MDFVPIPPSAYIYAGTQYEILREQVQAFEASLDPEHCVGGLLASFGREILMEVVQIDYEAPVLLLFRGYVNGNMSTLIQHVSQLSLLLTAIPRPRERERFPIGFRP